MVRLFLAIDVPEDIISILKLAQKDLPGRLNRNFHITLKFIGEAEDKDIPSLIRTLEQVSSPPFDLSIHEFGAFPDLSKPRVIWVGIEPKEPLVDLSTQINSLLKSSDDFKPHITLSRIGKKPAPLQPKKVPQKTFHVKEFHLYSSVLTPEGPIHKVIHTFSLA